MGNTIAIKDRGIVVKVQRTALIWRINKRLAAIDQRLHASKSIGQFATLGDFYIVSGKNRIVETHIDPIAYGRELGVLRPFEDAVGF